MKQSLFGIVVPGTFDEENLKAISVWEIFLLDAVGGFTRIPCDGAWRGSKRDEYEKNLLYLLGVKSTTSRTTLRRLMDIAKSIFRQQEIFAGTLGTFMCG